jgi:hypothetical protein
MPAATRSGAPAAAANSPEAPAAGQCRAPHEERATATFSGCRKEPSRLGGEESRRRSVPACQRLCSALEGRARARNVRGEGNDARRVSVGGETGDQPVEDVRRDARAAVEQKNMV